MQVQSKALVLSSPPALVLHIVQRVSLRGLEKRAPLQSGSSQSSSLCIWIERKGMKSLFEVKEMVIHFKLWNTSETPTRLWAHAQDKFSADVDLEIFHSQLAIKGHERQQSFSHTLSSEHHQLICWTGELWRSTTSLLTAK